ncbi:MAG: SWIM zinc finger family protein [Anaerolineaceae bacterium]|jgi:hypothetical protein|nr:SWIM zinc finger family protein [Anaerolineaceae bacterium]
MDYGMIGKIEKAKRYAQQKDRFSVKKLVVEVGGENNPHQVSYDDGQWTCDCEFFQSRGRCSHTMALEMILDGMIIVKQEDL